MRVSLVLLAVLPFVLAASLAASVPQPPVPRGPVHIPLKRSLNGVPLGRNRARDLDARQEPVTDIADVEAWSDSRASWYYLTISVGTPPQPVDVHIDTGSARLLVMSDTCNPDECDMSTAYSAASSSTFSTKNESVSAVFAGHSSYDGVWAEESIVVGGWRLDSYTFGLIESTANETAAPSLMGLAWDDPDGKTWSPSYLWATDGTWAEPLFGVYLARPGFAGPNDNVNGSLLTFGGIAADAIDGTINYVDSAVKNDWFVEIEQVHIGGVEVTLPDNKQIGALDTGTTGIYAPDAVLQSIFANVAGAVNGSDHGWTFPCNAANLNLTLTIGGVGYPLYWADMIWRSEGNVCFSNLYPNGRLTKNLQGWILGDAFLKNVYSIYRYKPHSIGLASLKAKYNYQANVIPGRAGNIVDPNGSSTGGTVGGSTGGGGGGSDNGNSNSNSNSNGNHSSDVATTSSRARLAPSRTAVYRDPSSQPTPMPNAAAPVRRPSGVWAVPSVLLITWCYT